MTRRCFAVPLAIVVPLVGLAACVTDPVHGRDDAQTSWHGRVEVELGAGRYDLKPRAFRHALELDATGVEGVTPQRGAGASIDEYDVFQGSVAWKPTWQLGSFASVSGLAGASYLDYDFGLGGSLAGGDSHAGTVGDQALSGLIGSEIRAGLPLAGLYGRVTQSIHYASTSRVAEVGIAFHPHPSTSLQIAYRWWEVEGEGVAGAGDVFDDLELDVEGLTIGGVVRF